MELPNKSRAYIPANKISGYLLSQTHAIGKSKARYFRSFGFDETNAVELEQGLLTIAQTGSIEETSVNPHGAKYVIDGFIKTPKGAMISVRTIWIIETNDNKPRFVTAYPTE
ncbi:MAG: hypothetical protein JW963_15980 [Anaerolineales bacterium]|nr:hypothetical protein [Anaerolineales bacterium]